MSGWNKLVLESSITLSILFFIFYGFFLFLEEWREARRCRFERIANVPW